MKWNDHNSSLNVFSKPLISLPDSSYNNQKEISQLVKICQNVLFFPPREIRAPSIILSLDDITDVISKSASINTIAS